MTTATEALRYLHYEAARCHDRDSHEALCLLLPAVMKVLALHAMDDFEAADFKKNFRIALSTVNELPLVECVCAVCGGPEGVRADMLRDGVAVWWCGDCARERQFAAVNGNGVHV
ncbi:MAG TPA: hypothetical protein PKA41_11075 [Verrucomicrobiota bacterium]|nr:hypothetical protein [Verrucomicrobiota bacterium]